MPVLRVLFSRKSLLFVAGSTALVAGGGYSYLNSGPAYPASTRETRRAPPPWTPPPRSDMLAALRASAATTRKKEEKGEEEQEGEHEFDLLVVGGGATGAGIAVDAATRGLKVALVERDDFSSGTSSKSTKLVHGGVRYLQKAVFELDYEQYKLVREALHERKIFLQTAPYLSSMLPIMLPIYKYWQVPYYWAGCKLYDILAGKENMETSYLMSKGKAIEAFPMLKQDGLVGALVYYDGQHNDSRMNIALIMTAVRHGAVALNHCEVTDLHKDPTTGRLNGAQVRDALTGESIRVHAKGVINATGPFSDTLLKLDDPTHEPIVQPSSGIHITLPNYYSPRTMGLLDPATSDGRVIFFLPWQGNTIAGTTDSPAEVKVGEEPKASEDEIRWVLDEVRRYLSPDIRVRRGDVLSAWSGLRPLVRAPSSDGSTEGLVRNHLVHVSKSGLVTVAGGKWTTYREMAKAGVDAAVQEFGLGAAGECRTEGIRLVGSDGWTRNMFIGLIQRYGLETDVARHLSENYGDRAWSVLGFAEPTGRGWPVYGNRLVAQYPFIDAEVRYAVHNEYARTAVDVLARRTRLAFLNVRAAAEALPAVVEIMGEELGWGRKEKERQVQMALEFFGTMGLERGYVVPSPRLAMGKPVGWTEWVCRGIGWTGVKVKQCAELEAEQLHGGKTTSGMRARFEPGEIAVLAGVFGEKAESLIGADGQAEVVLELGKLKSVVRGVGGGYESVTDKEFEYVLDEAGVRGAVDFDGFVEVCGGLKDVVFARGVKTGVVGGKRGRIPVEKSGGGI